MRHPEPKLFEARLRDLEDLGCNALALRLRRAEKTGNLLAELRLMAGLINAADPGARPICAVLLDLHEDLAAGRGGDNE